MNSPLQTVASILGRIMIATIFLMSAVGNKIPNFSGVVVYMTGEGVPSPRLMLALAIVFLLFGSVSVILGYHARFGAALLLVFLALATYYFHDFWTFTGQEKDMQMIQFMKNLSMMGAMIFIIANGPGQGSLNGRRATPTA